MWFSCVVGFVDASAFRDPKSVSESARIVDADEALETKVYIIDSIAESKIPSVHRVSDCELDWQVRSMGTF